MTSPTRRERLRTLVSHPIWEITIGAFTLAAVFGFPAYTLAAPAGLTNPIYTVVVFVFFAVFAIDWLTRLIAFGTGYLKSLYFWVDGLATLSLLIELPGTIALSTSGAWPNPRVLRMSVYVTRLSRLARQSRTIIRMRDLFFRRRLGHSASAAEHKATELQRALEMRFNSLVALFVVLGLLLVPLRELFTQRDDLHRALQTLAASDDPAYVLAQEEVLRADPRVLQVSSEVAAVDLAALAQAKGLGGYEIGRYSEGHWSLVVSHREERLAGARLDMLLALFIIFVMVTMSAAFSSATHRILILPLRELQLSIEEAIERNDALGFLRSVEDTEPVKFLQRVFIPLLERLVAAVNVEARESILRAEAGPLARERDWAILLTDIQGFTTLMETLGHQGFTAINEYFRHCAAVVAEFGGDIFEHTGDGFIVTVGETGKEGRAYEMAVRIVERLEQVTATAEWQRLIDHPAWADDKLRRIRTRIGIHCGEVTTGRIGTDRICRYGLIGEAANISARLESANKLFGTWVLISEPVARKAPAALTERTRRVDRVIVVGTHEPVDLFTYDFTPSARYSDFRAAFDLGLERYFAGDWAVATQRFAEAQAIWPEDGVTIAITRRMALLGPAAPAGWTGAYKLGQK